MSDFEKYGVLEDPETVDKTAEEKTPQRCPDCDSALVPSENVNVLMCPKCGTKPFER